MVLLKNTTEYKVFVTKHTYSLRRIY